MFIYKRMRSMLQLNRNVKLVLIANLCIGFAFVGVSSLITNLYLASLRFDSVFIGNLNGVGLLSFTLAALPAGMLGSRFGPRRMALWGEVITALGISLFLLTVHLPQSLWQASMTLSLAIAYAGGAAGMVNLNTYTMSVASPQERQQAFAFSATFMALGAMLGNLAGGLLPGMILQLGKGAVNETAAYHWVLWLVVAGYAGAALALWKTRPAQAASEDSEAAREVDTNSQEKRFVRLLVFLGVLFLIQIFSESAFSTFMNLYLSQELAVPVAMIGTINAAFNPLIVLSAPLLLHLLKRFGAGRTLVHGSIVVATCAFLAAFFRLPGVVFAAMFFCSLMMNFNTAARNLFGQETVSPRWRPLASAVTSISWSFGSAIAALAGGRLIAGLGYQALFIVSAVASSISILVYAGYERIKAPRIVAAATVSQ